MNSTVRLSFKEKFVEIRTCGSHEQCTRSIEKKHRPQEMQETHYPNSAIIYYKLDLKH